MDEAQPEADRSDPGARAVARLKTLRARDRYARVGTALALAVLAIAGPLAAEPITGDPGSTVGAIVAALLFLALAAAVWPYDWSPDELTHRELEAIWRELRSDADHPLPWERYAAWAQPREESVEVALISCAPTPDRVAGAPSPYGVQVVRRLDADDVAAAAEAMEELRARASEQELGARQRHENEQEEAQRRAHERVLREIDEAAATHQRSEEERLEHEMAQRETAERRAHAESVAKALRRQ